MQIHNISPGMTHINQELSILKQPVKTVTIIILEVTFWINSKSGTGRCQFCRSNGAGGISWPINAICAGTKQRNISRICGLRPLFIKL